MRDDPQVVALVTRASGGDQDAWHQLVNRYAPLVYTICIRYRLSNHDIEDVGQNVWLLLVEQLGKLREPAALPGWLATTTARECLRVVTAAHKSERLGTGLDEAVLFVDDAVIDEEILMAERNAALRAAFAELPPRCQQLLSMLMSAPSRSYAGIRAELGIPAGSTGLTEAHLALTYDPSVFTVSARDVHLGSVLAAGSGWSVRQEAASSETCSEPSAARRIQ